MMKNSHLVEKMKDIVEVEEEIDGLIGSDPKLIEYEVDELAAYLNEIGVNVSKAKADQTTEAQRQAQEHYLSIILFSAEDCNQSIERLLQELNDGSLKGQSIFPATPVEALAMLNDYSPIAPMPRATDIYGEVAFI